MGFNIKGFIFLVFICVLFLLCSPAWPGVNAFLPYPQCTSDKDEIARLEHKMTITIIKVWGKAGINQNINLDKAWLKASRLAKVTVRDNYMCRSLS